MPESVVGWEAVREVAFGAITNAYVKMGSNFAFNIGLFIMTNTTDKDMFLSFDGSTDHIRLITGVKNQSLDLKSQDLIAKYGTAIYLKYSAAPGSGAVSISAAYRS